MISFLQCNAEWICAIIISLFATLQWHISKKQKNLMLLERRLELKKNFNLFTTKIMETTSYPQKDLEKLSNEELYEMLKNLPLNKINVTCESDTISAMKTYINSGFVKSGEYKHFYLKI